MPQHSPRRRAVHLTFAVGLGTLLACTGALPASAASSNVVAIAPAGTATLWIDFEGADNDTIVAQLKADGSSADLDVKRTTLGATAITTLKPGEVTIAVSTSGDTLPTVSLTFADADGTVLDSSTRVLDGNAGNPGDGATPGDPDSEDPDGDLPGSGTPGSGTPGSGTPAAEPLTPGEQAAKDKQLAITGASISAAGLIALLATGGGLLLRRMGLTHSKAAQR